ncbi:MAG: MgtC/SapB family protein [Gemmatimonadaceae bacterium]
MNPTITWNEIAIRIAATLIGSALIGINRSERGHEAGLRTTMLVALAGALSMIEVNILLATSGRGGSSFVMLDLMRLPLGILTGMGFIGAGAILRRGTAVSGITTAATLWLVTMIGLCFGGGQILLGSIAVIISLFVLWTLKGLDTRLLRENRAVLTIRGAMDTDMPALVRDVAAAGFIASTALLTRATADGYVESKLDVRWRGEPVAEEPAELIARLAGSKGVTLVEWRR